MGFGYSVTSHGNGVRDMTLLKYKNQAVNRDC